MPATSSASLGTCPGQELDFEGYLTLRGKVPGEAGADLTTIMKIKEGRRPVSPDARISRRLVVSFAAKSTAAGRPEAQRCVYMIR